MPVSQTDNFISILQAACGNGLFSPIKIIQVKIVEPGAYHGKFAAGHHETLLVHYANGPVYIVFHLDNNVLEYPAGHILFLLYLVRSPAA